MDIIVTLEQIRLLVKLFNEATQRIMPIDKHIDRIITNGQRFASPDKNLWVDYVKGINPADSRSKFHRGYKELIGTEKRQCCTARL